MTNAVPAPPTDPPNTRDGSRVWEIHLSDKEMRRKEKVTGNVLDAVIQIISLAIVQNHLAAKIKRPSLEVLEEIAKMTLKTKPITKLVSWLNRQMSYA
ncbi:hypothetical protein Tco_0502252 [Tanacetum coccineum]